MIDEMTLDEADEIFTYWEENPPPHLMLQTIARMLGWAPGPPPTAAPPDLVAAGAPPGLSVTRGGDLGMPAPLDLDALRLRNRTRASGQPTPL